MLQTLQMTVKLVINRVIEYRIEESQFVFSRNDITCIQNQPILVKRLCLILEKEKAKM